MSFKDLIKKKMTRETKFMGESVKISKLSVAEVEEIQAIVKQQDENTEDYTILQKVICLAVEDANELSMEDFKSFPLDELNKLSKEIMKFSGLNTEEGK
jgi:hypothetical protein